MFEPLKKLQAATESRRITDLFDDDAERAERYCAGTGDMRLDYSRTNIDDAARLALIDLCDTADVAARREAMFTGQAINETEGRAVLHTALRNLDGGSVLVDGADVMPGILDTGVSPLKVINRTRP